jgi:DNA recombination protein RmuC
MDIAAVLIALLTLAAGIAVGWALARNRIAATLADLQATAAAAGAERDATASERDRERADHATTADALRAAEARATEAAARLKTQEETEIALKDSFARLQNEAMATQQKQFLELADNKFREARLPLTESLTKVEHQLREIEKNRVSAQDVLTQQIEQVRKSSEDVRQETATLVSALRKPQARGRWGELQLRRCVELAGMTDRCDFTEQTTVSTADGLLRPDLVVRLVGGKSVVIDSKVTLAAYLEAYDATDDAVREERLAAHARHMRKHIDQLAAKAYWSQFSPAPEFVVLFVPGDPFLAAALDRDPGLLDYAFDRRVHIASPTTLISVLRAVAYAWQQEALAEKAAKVFDLGKELYSRLSTMGDRFDKLGRQLNGAVNAYNDTATTLEGRVFVTARKLNTLKVTDADLSLRNPVENAPNALSAPELVESAEAARSVVVLPGTDETLLEPAHPEDYGIDAARPKDAGRRTGS